MPRAHTFELTTDTGHFTPLQLQLRNLLSTGFNALSQWLRANWVSFPDLISKHRFSVVILGTSVEWRAPLKFFDGPTLTLTSTLKIQRKGTRAQLDTEVKGATGVAARVGILLCPVEVVELEGLSATPTRVPERLASLLQPDELELGVTPRRVVPDVRAALEKSGKMIGEHKSAFTVHRHHCEVADQWAFFEVAGLVGASREAMALEGVAKQPALQAALGTPLQRFDMELSRPYYWFQPGTVASTAWVLDGRLVVVHRLLSPVPGGEEHGVAVERF
ncbi:MAG TPA: hypothetical protein VI197_28060 [Polyangiaceae bacterium]